MNEYIVSFKDSLQISRDDWRIVSRVLKVNDQTTIGEIREWYATILKKEPFMETVNLTQLSNS